MSNKTKAALQGRQCQNAYQIHSQLITQIDHVKRCSDLSNGNNPTVTGFPVSLRLAGGCLSYISCDTAFPKFFGDVFPVVFDAGILTAPLAQFIKISRSLNQRRNSAIGSITHTKSIQPFGSIPRCCSSLRRILLIQVASDESPSLRISSSSWERSSCARRIWYWSVFTFSLDIVITKLLVLPCGCNYNVTYLDLQPLNMAKPRSATTRSGLLTTNANETSEAAMNNYITPLNGRITYTPNSARPAFTWLFLGTPASTSPCTPIVLRTEANTETEARERFPTWSLTFAAKIRTECAVVHHRSGVVMFDIAEVFHG